MTPALTTDLGLKPEHYDVALNRRAHGSWFEVHPENYFVEGGAGRAWRGAGKISLDHVAGLK